MQNIATDALKPLRWSTIYRNYDGIRHLCAHTNQAFGFLITWFVAHTIMNNSIGLDSVLSIPDRTVQIRFLFGAYASVGTLMLAADVCDQVS